MSEDTETETIVYDPEYNWVLEQMLRLGVPYEDAQYLTETGADYRDVAKLLSTGCPMSLAVRIAG